MIKDIISDSELWLAHMQAWNRESAISINSILMEAYETTKDACTAISSSGLTGITGISQVLLKSKIDSLELEREKLYKFCEGIHENAEEEIDRPFHYNVMKSLTELYDLNPKDIVLSSTTPNVNLAYMMSQVVVDPALAASFTMKEWSLNWDEMNDDLKKSLIESVGRYYDGDVTKYMNGSVSSNEFNKDIDLVIEYYEYLNPEDAKNLDDLFEEMKNDTTYDYSVDIKNIKFIAYTAPEPYKSVFFEYAGDLDIAEYNYPEKDSNGDSLSQHYSSDVKKLYLRFHGTVGEGKDDRRGAYAVFFHEVGHAIDDLITMDKENKFLFWTTSTDIKWTTNHKIFSDGLTVQQTAENDVRENISKAVEEYAGNNGYNLSMSEINKIVTGLISCNFQENSLNKSCKKIYNAVKSQYSIQFSQSSTEATIYNGISDVYGGFTDNKTRGSYGHSTKNTDGTSTYYWNSKNGEYTGKQSKELWAHVFARQMTNNTDSLQKMQEYFPESLKKIEEVSISLTEGNN
ncbi:hypothetical protein [Anaerosporobacter sp.]